MRILLAVGLLLAAPQLRAADWIPLFNGKDLTGWRANSDPESFTVKDGVLRIQGLNGPAHLFYVGEQKTGFETLRNFEFEATVRAEPESNSGVFVHTGEELRPKTKYLAKGYEVQLNSSPKDKIKTGSLYNVEDLAESPVDETKWFKVRIVVVGKHITVELDGKKVIDYTEPADVKRPKGREGRVFSAEGGAIALQAHDPKSVWYFKDIRLKRLP